MENQVLIQNNNGFTVPILNSQPQQPPCPSFNLIPLNCQQEVIPSCSITIDDYDYDYNDYYENNYLDSFPPGYRFQPYDEELIEGYLKRKLKNLPLPPNKIHEVNIYQQNPDTLKEKYEAQGEKEWYFFTPRDKKYAKGQRPSRTAKDGYWKATAGDKAVKLNGHTIGYRKTLVFYQGKPQNAKKTSWIMQEYKADSPSNSRRDQNDMKLDDWVLCKIYKKEYKKAGMNITETDSLTEMDSTDHYNQETYIDSVETNIMPQVLNQQTYIDRLPGGCQDDIPLEFTTEDLDYILTVLEPATPQ